ncbi:retrotransposon protein, putative, ty1-copia subclass [Tanacetum coccineum]
MSLQHKEAMASPGAPNWKEAMKSEIQRMYDNKVWKFGLTLTTGLKTVDLAKIKSIRIMLAIAAFQDVMKYGNDVKPLFPNENYKDVFMAQPEGFENAKYPKRVCKLQKAIYGLKQASRSWNLCFHEKVTQFGFSRDEEESCKKLQNHGSIVVS